MTVIEAASMSCRTMADGTLRLSVDIEPRHAQAAFSLFGSPGTPMALAALNSQSEPEPPTPDKPKGGVLSQWCGMRCNEPAFQEWLATKYPIKWQHFSAIDKNPTYATAAVIRMVCGIESRAELDHDEAAAERFNRLIRHPWQRHCVATGATA